MRRLTVYYTLAILLCSCSFDHKKWNEEGKEYERKELVDGLFHSFLKFDMSRDTVILVLGEPYTVCDSVYGGRHEFSYGAFRDYEFDDIKSELIIKDDFIFELISNTPCSDFMTIDRYTHGMDASGPESIALIYDEHNLLKLVFFEEP